MKEQYQKEMKEALEKSISKELDKIQKIENQDEKLIKLDFLYNIHKILMNYKELEPKLKDFFEKKKIMDKIRNSKETFGKEK